MNNLFLIGYRGTGKSASPRMLAEKLGWQAVDADVYLETKFGTTIRDIFAEEGERSFRDKETAVLQEICRQSHQVVATGGGIILRPENRALLRQSGQTVWLTATPETIWQRCNMMTPPPSRPNLTTGGLEEIKEVLAQREAIYRESADWIVDTEKLTPEEVAAKIVRNFNSPENRTKG